MKVFQVCPRYFPAIGGVEEHVRNISERLAKEFEVFVLTTDPSGTLPEEEVINGVLVKRFRSWAPSESYYFSPSLRKFFSKNLEVNGILHAHNYGAFPALYAAQEKKSRTLVFSPHYHGSGHTSFRSLLHIPYKFLGKSIFEKAERIVCVSNYEKSLVLKRFKIDEEKVVVIPNGVDLDEFKSLKKQSKDYRVILSVGRLEKYKGMQYLVKTLPKLDRNIILEIVGKGPYKGSLVKLAKKLKVEERVRFFQDLPRHELLQMYADADVLVLLSKHEAYGISVAEALCAGTPCIVADASALSEWIDNKNCFGIDYPVSSDKLASLVENVMGKRVQKVVIPSWDEVSEKLAHIYEELSSF